MELANQAKNTPYGTGLVLSGGAYRGMGQVGALKALKERGVEPDILCGTSSGAINAVLYASGYSPEEMRDIWYKEPFGKVLNLHLPRFGLLKHSKIGELIAPYLRHQRLEELPIPVYLTSTCLNDGEQKVFTEGDLLQLLQAACAVPLVFEPVEIEGRQYIDGGVVSNLPAEPLRPLCQHLIGISVNPIPFKEKLNGITDTLYRTIWIGLEGSVKKTSQLCDWLIAPTEMGERGFMERSALELFFQSGYDFTSRFLEEKGVMLTRRQK
ncbi:patatin-like phospholipase family protein [Cesiribacter andamanensis]|uniref:NTE family protein rssA n=1 Tax=Cesiribacter andamanensis AMV16 TaxID=1279009 RepID=M7P2M7_9BACT|nr:patatin-like phospholipase family protein [Cesiribacter andamanensis]EMR04789.1 NTE family protein rssA [Cesiribacter andamanensis AMV16]